MLPVALRYTRSMAPKAPSPRRVAAAVKAVAAGESLRDVADVYGVSFVTVSRWVAKYKAEQKAAAKNTPKSDPPWKGLTSSLAQRSAPPDEEESEPAEAGTLLEQVRALQRDMLDTAKAAKGVGNMKAAQAALASAGLLANTIARIAKTEADSADVFKISRAEIGATADGLRERLKTMRDRPLCCAECSRRLSVELAYEGREKPDVIKEFLDQGSIRP